MGLAKLPALVPAALVQAAAAAWAEPPTSQLALVGGMLLDGYDGPPLHHAAVLIEGDRIMPPARAIAAATRAGARILGREQELGTIEPGKRTSWSWTGTRSSTSPPWPTSRRW